MEAFDRAAHLADFRQRTDKEGNLKEPVEAGAARNATQLAHHKVGAPGLMKLPAVK